MTKNKEANNHNKGLLKGTLVGAVVGAIAALLLAPKSGKETQADLKKRAKQVVKDADERIVEMESELEGRIDNLKLAARDLRGEAYEDSQRLITRAEILKNDLQDSAARVSKAGNEVKGDAMTDAKRLVSEGATVMSELEKMTKKIMASAKEKAKSSFEGGDEHQEK
jgi:gas vesicle protein